MRVRALFDAGPLVSEIGFGASPLGNVFGVVSREEGERAVHLAMDRGINFFDTSPYYGLTLSEQRLGDALRGRRDRVVLATKCGRFGANEFDFSAEAVSRSVEDSLRRLGTDHVDLLQVHDCEFATVEQIVEETLPALEACRSAGKTRWIGITGYGLHNLRTIAERAFQSGVRLDSVLSYCRQNLANTDMEAELRSLVEAPGVGLINASPLHMGLLTEAGAPAWHPAGPGAREAAMRASALCRSQNVRLEELALRFALSCDVAASTFVGMGETETVLKNLHVSESADFAPELVNAVREILREGGAAEVWPSGLAENWGPGVKEMEVSHESVTSGSAW